MEKDELSISGLIMMVKDELIKTANRRVKDGKEPLFTLGNIELQINFTIKEVSGTDAKASIFKLIAIGAEDNYETSQSHRVTIVLHPHDDPAFRGMRDYSL